MVDPGPLLADNELAGTEWCRVHAGFVDDWLARLFTDAGGADEGTALVAVGGYGRSELCPQSDIDLMLVHDGRRDVAALADRIWYPIWDEGLHLGHSVCTVGQALDLASDDLDTATALLSARIVAGDPSVAETLAAAAHALGAAGENELMCRISQAARTIAWTSDDTWRRIRSALRGPLGRVNRRTQELGGGIKLRDGEIVVGGDADPSDATVALRAAAL